MKNEQKISLASQIHLNRFKPRDYQIPICDALENKKYKRILCIMPRRAGKDIVAWNLMIRAAIRRVAVYYYIFPTYNQGRKIIWDSITISGMKFLDFIPSQLIESTNSQEMKVRLKNGSIIQLVGSDNVDSLVGSNPYGLVFSEYALQDPKAYQFLRPILLANDGWALFVSTPRGKNHMWELYNIAKESKDWYCYRVGLDETQHIPLQEIEKERAEGLISEDLIQQEYYCSFEMGVEGSYYLKYLDKMRVSGQIGIVPWEPAFKVHTSWDLGVRDTTAIIFFQSIGQTVRIIDCYEKSKEGLEHYIKVVNSKPYSYGRHFAPHDIAVTEWGSGLSRIEKAKQLGLQFVTASNISIEDGIETVRSSFAKIWIDEVKCKQLIKSLENYRQEYDSKRRVYRGCPLHDWSSNFCFTGDTLILTRNGMRPIMEIEENDEVLTLQGWKPCTKAIRTAKNAKLVEVKFADGTIVKCTPDHLFLTTHGWKYAKNLMRNTKIQSSLTNLLNILMEDCIVYGRMRNTFLEVEKHCIDQCGRMLLEQYLKIAIYIIKTVIPSITISGISNVFQKKSTLDFLDQITKDLQQVLGIKQPNGIDLTREDYGINDMLKELKVGQSGKDNHESASYVNECLHVLYAEMGMSKNFVTQTVKQLTIADVKLLKEKADVYDITVPGMGHFSLSNGAIVHNSDSMRYLCLSLPKTRDGLSPEELEKRYQEAVYGDEGQLPRMFRNDKY